MAQTNCRLPDPLDEKLEKAADERQVFKSELIRRSIRFYVKKNPDEIRALTHPSDRKRRTGSDRDRSDVTGGRGPGDRAGRVREETLELDRDGEVDQEESDSEPSGSAVYDPTTEV